MEIFDYILIAAVAFFLASRFMPVKGIRQITTGELKNELKDKSKQFIDVRTVDEFRGRKINGFKNIPLQELSQRAEELSKDKEVVVICQSGMRSGKAARLLKKKGFTSITNVKGGMSAW